MNGTLRAEHRHGKALCPGCGRLVDLDRFGRYRRHFAVGPGGGRGLCSASGHASSGVVQLLRTEPTAEERYSHALRLLGTMRAV